MPPKSTSGGGPRITGGRKTLILGSVIFGLTVISIVLLSHHGFYKIYCLRQERSRLEHENARLAEKNTRLARTIDRLQHDPEMIQDLIRRELNFVKKNEIIVQLPDEAIKKPLMGAMLPPPASPSPKEPSGSASPRQKAQTTSLPRRTP